MTWWELIYTICDYIEERDLKMYQYYVDTTS